MIFYTIGKLFWSYGRRKVRREAHWAPPMVNVINFNADGAARGKPGPAGV